MNDELIDFLDEEEQEELLPFWDILVVDDEQEVLDVTEMTLRDFQYKDLGANFTMAKSYLEAKEILDSGALFSVMIVDVVMEEDDSGLQFANYVRNIAHDENARIIIRTGQPGARPKEEVLHYFDISAYYEKTELTVALLKSVVHQQLREYSRLAYYKRELKKVKHKIGRLATAAQQCKSELPECHLIKHLHH